MISSAIYSSDLLRASDTAKEIAKFHNNVPVKLTANLRERNLGELQGKNKKEFGYHRKNSLSFHTECGESLEQMHNRAKKFVCEVFLRNWLLSESPLLSAHLEGFGDPVHTVLYSTRLNAESPGDIGMVF